MSKNCAGFLCYFSVFFSNHSNELYRLSITSSERMEENCPLCEFPFHKMEITFTQAFGKNMRNRKKLAKIELFLKKINNQRNCVSAAAPTLPSSDKKGWHPFSCCPPLEFRRLPLTQKIPLRLSIYWNSSSGTGETVFFTRNVRKVRNAAGRM